MPSLSFEGETHDELVRKVRRWLASVEGDDQHLSAVEAVEKASEITKDALSVIAAAAPGPIASSDILKGLRKMGYDATDSTKRAVTSGLNALADVTNGGLLKRADRARKDAVYEMNASVARQMLKTLRG
ncbi:MAG: hypothetical protein JOZ68_04670 [Acidimicrobiia bacterium]|nr:hypothetical protein [Acidimicrobiia bacterium]MBV8986186.1 hypothetical protein [Acidimicrobiia bacterium]MBV9040269.1 hypothetical protein [Acidimicrobiia bacterium]MBV9285641.1 hypothetical protein [Acidimicrobiia bacterium]